MRNRKRFYAMTLAEVLITIGIIGVLAALTIPTLLQKSNDKELVSQTIKVANILSNAFKQADTIEGLTRKTYEDSADFVMVLYSYLKVLNQDEFGYVLMDGSRIKFLHDTYSSTCENNLYDDGLPSAFRNVCMQVEVDVNGKKGPNTPGKDIYRFYVTKQGVFPDGNPTGCEEGYDCGAYVLANHKLWDGEIAEVASQNPNPPNCSGNCGSPSIYAEDEENEMFGLPCNVTFKSSTDNSAKGYLCELEQEYIITISLDDYLTLGRSDCSDRPCNFADTSAIGNSEDPTTGQYHVKGDIAAYMIKPQFQSTYAEYQTQCQSLGYSIPTSDSQIADLVETHHWDSDKWYITNSGKSCSDGQKIIKQYNTSNYECIDLIDGKIPDSHNENIRAICVGEPK